MKMNSTVEDISPNILDIMITALSYSLTVTLPANAYVLWLILQGNRLAPDIFYFNLSAEEIFCSMSTIIVFISVVYNCIPCIESFSFFNGLFKTGRPLFQCLICLECYMGVNYPMLFLRLKPLRYRLTCSAVSWLLVAFSCIYSHCTFRKNYHLFTVFFQNLFFLFAVLYCLVSVLRTLKHPGPGGNAQKKSHRTKMRAFKILSVIMANMSVNFLLCTAPIPLQLCLPKQKFEQVLTICSCASFITGSMLPLIYLQRAEKVLCLQLH